MKTILTIRNVDAVATERIHSFCVPFECKAGWVEITGNMYVECTSPAQAAHIIINCESDGFELDYRIDVTQ